ncbi:MAG: hypothetical protein ACI857_000157 [Arenicella sp.]|jgi:uncharacterized protein (TIGR02145 family)
MKFLITLSFLMVFRVSSGQKDTSYFDLDKWRIILMDTVIDLDGNVYRTQQLGDQVWMVENLAVSQFNEGEKVPQSWDKNLWQNTKSALMVNLKAAELLRFPTTDNFMLYNGYVVKDERRVCPIGWKVPDSVDWNNLFVYVDSINEAWNKWHGSVYSAGDSLTIQQQMKEDGIIDMWDQPYLFFTGHLPSTNEIELGSTPTINTTIWWTSEGASVHSWYGVSDRHFELEDLVPHFHYKNILNRGYKIRCISD